jgi:hypothetical protein
MARKATNKRPAGRKDAAKLEEYRTAYLTLKRRDARLIEGLPVPDDEALDLASSLPLARHRIDHGLAPMPERAD